MRPTICPEPSTRHETVSATTPASRIRPWKPENPSRGPRPVRPPSDWPTADEWVMIAPLLPEPFRRGRHRTTDLRQVVTAIRHHLRTGCPWRKLPPGSPPWPTVYTYFRRWLKDGTLRKLRPLLRPTPLPPTPPRRPAERSSAKWNPGRGFVPRKADDSWRR